MNDSCARYRFWLEEDEGRTPDSVEQQARAEHLRVCEDCREEMKGVVAQRATVRGVFRPEAAPPPLSGAFVRRCVSAMVQATREEGNRGRSTG